MKKQFALVGILAASIMSFTSVQAEDEKKDSCATGQDLTPLKQVGMYLDGYHTYRKEANVPAEDQKQVRTAHYCKQVNPDLFQCLIYDGNNPNARVIGVEYVITDKLFQTLSAEEKKFWHDHDSEVDTGLLILPGLPAEKQKEILGVLRTTHGKTWQTWNNLSDAVPIGEPALMWNVDPSKISTTTKKSVATRQTDPTF